MTLPEPNTSPKKKSNWTSLVVWILIAILVRWQVIEPRWIPSGSMLPSLEVKDKLLIEKITPKYNFVFNKHPHRDSIVVFKPTNSLIKAGYNSNQALIKRVVGLPSDKIEVKNGKLIRNDVTVNEPWILEKIEYEMPPIIVPPDSLWVLGDNRNNSLDSHFWGPLPEKNVIGTASLRYWPLKKLGPIRFPASSKTHNFSMMR